MRLNRSEVLRILNAHYDEDTHDGATEPGRDDVAAALRVLAWFAYDREQSGVTVRGEHDVAAMMQEITDHAEGLGWVL